MFPCCQLCYHKYINEAGEIDAARMEAALVAEYVNRPETDALLSSPCTCPCHVDGQTVMH